MALDTRYITAEKYRRIFTKTKQEEDVDIEADIDAIMDWIDRDLNRHFNLDAAVTAREYAVPNTGEINGTVRDLVVLDIGDSAGVIIKADDDDDGVFETTIPSGDYQLLPLNAATTGREAWPFTKIRIPNWATQRSAWPQGLHIEVTAKHGWPQVPKAIERATGHLVGILRLESPRATRRVSESLDSTIETSREAQGIIKDLRNTYRRIPAPA